MDRLACEGVRFARNYCNSPVCTPSRQSMLTGQLPHSAGVTVVDTPLSTDKPTVAKQLKAAGYRTAAMGKIILHEGNAGARAMGSPYPRRWHRKSIDKPCGS